MADVLSQDEIVRIMRETGALDRLDISEGDVRDGHHRVDEVLPAMELAYALGIARAIAVAWRHVLGSAGRKAPDLLLLDAATELGVRDTFHEHLNWSPE